MKSGAGGRPIAFLVVVHDIVVVRVLVSHEFGARTKIRRMCIELDNLCVRSPHCRYRGAEM